MALISEILDGLPSSLARMCRMEFSANPTVSDLTRELQILVPRWRQSEVPGGSRRTPTEAWTYKIAKTLNTSERQTSKHPLNRSSRQQLIN